MKLLSAAVLLSAVYMRGAVSSPLSFELLSQDFTLAIEEMAIVRGYVANFTGISISAKELFVNAYEYDPDAVVINQVVGTVDFILPTDSISDPIALFEVKLTSRAQPDTRYSARVFLQDAFGNETETASVTIRADNAPSIPEPSTFGTSIFALAALLILAAKRFTQGRLTTLRSFTKTLFALLSAVYFLCGSEIAAQTPRFSTGNPVVALGSTGAIDLAIPISNSGSTSAEGVVITSAQLQASVLNSTQKIPMELGTIPVQGSVPLHLFFNSTAPNESKRLLTVKGIYRLNRVPMGFTLNRYLTIPPAGSVNGIRFTTFPNASDPLLIRGITADGSTVDYHALKNIDGLASRVSSVKVTSSTGLTSTLFFDEAGRLERAVAPNGSRLDLEWLTTTRARLYVASPDNSFKESAEIDFTSVKSVFPSSQPRMSGFGSSTTILALAAQSTITVTSCGSREPIVTMNVRPTLGLPFDLFAHRTSIPGRFSVPIPLPEPGASSRAVERCRSFLGDNAIVSSICGANEAFEPICFAVGFLVARAGAVPAALAILASCPLLQLAATQACLLLDTVKLVGFSDIVCKSFAPPIERALSSMILQPRASVDTLPQIVAYGSSMSAPPVPDFTISIPACIDRLEIRPTPAIVGVGGKITLTAIAKDRNNNQIAVSPRNLSWLTSDMSLVSVSAAGEITGLKIGVAKIIVTESSSGKSAEITVTIRGPMTATVGSPDASHPLTVVRVVTEGCNGLPGVTRNSTHVFTGPPMPAYTWGQHFLKPLLNVADNVWKSAFGAFPLTYTSGGILITETRNESLSTTGILTIAVNNTQTSSSYDKTTIANGTLNLNSGAWQATVTSELQSKTPPCHFTSRTFERSSAVLSVRLQP